MRHRRADRNGKQAQRSLERAERELAEQQRKHAQEEPLRAALRRYLERNHLAEAMADVLSQHRQGE